MRLLPESNRLLAGEFDSDCRHRAKPVNEGAAGARMVHGESMTLLKVGSVQMDIRHECVAFMV